MRSGLLIVLLHCTFLASCADHSHRVDGTDLPKVPSTKVQATTLKSVQGRTEEGRILFSGSIYDALERIRWTGRGFKADGWTQRAVSGSPREATALFTSPWSGDEERLAVLHVVADPVHGTATVTVSIEAIKDVDARVERAGGTSASGGVPRTGTGGFDEPGKPATQHERSEQNGESGTTSDAEHG